MLAIVKYQQGNGFLDLRDVPEPEPGPGEVKIQVQAAGICGSDLHIVHGDIEIPVKPPVVLGHEFSGYIVKLGEGVTRWRVGQRVTGENTRSVCGRCEYCMTGDYNLCTKRLATGYAFDGAFAPYCIVPEERVHRLPDSVDFVTGALSDPSACAWRAVSEKTAVQAGEKVLITGPGPMGLFCTQYAHINGSTVILGGLPRDEWRLALGRKLGADYTVDLSRPEARDEILDIAGPRGVDVVLECSGAGPAAQLGLEVIRKRGRFTQVGIYGHPFQADLDKLVYKEIVMTGIFSQKYLAWEKAIELAAEGKIDARALVTDVLPLSEWEKGFGRFERGEALKVVFEPQRA